jgi:hypothetical protein
MNPAILIAIFGAAGVALFVMMKNKEEQAKIQSKPKTLDDLKNEYLNKIANGVEKSLVWYFSSIGELFDSLFSNTPNRKTQDAVFFSSTFFHKDLERFKASVPLTKKLGTAEFSGWWQSDLDNVSSFIASWEKQAKWRAGNNTNVIKYVEHMPATICYTTHPVQVGKQDALDRKCEVIFEWFKIGQWQLYNAVGFNKNPLIDYDTSEKFYLPIRNYTFRDSVISVEKNAKTEFFSNKMYPVGFESMHVFTGQNVDLNFPGIAYNYKKPGLRISHPKKSGDWFFHSFYIREQESFGDSTWRRRLIARIVNNGSLAKKVSQIDDVCFDDLDIESQRKGWGVIYFGNPSTVFLALEATFLESQNQGKLFFQRLE